MRIDPELADELVATVRAFVAKDVLPVASELEHTDEYPTDLVEQMRALGLFGATIPVEHGGLGLDVATYARVVEELAVGWMSLTGILNTHMIAATLITQHGTPDIGCDVADTRNGPQLATGQGCDPGHFRIGCARRALPLDQDVRLLKRREQWLPKEWHHCKTG